MEQTEQQSEMAFYFWVGNGGDSISVTEEEFNELFEAKRKLQNDFLNVEGWQGGETPENGGCWND